MCLLKMPSETAAVSTSSRKATRLLKAKERREMSQTLGLGTVLRNFDGLYDTFQATIDRELDLQCFPDRMEFWHSIKGTAALKEVVKAGARKYMDLYTLHGKGRDKYSSLYRDWLNYQLVFTDNPDTVTKQLWEALVSCHTGVVSVDTRRVILCSILNGVQSWLQQKISVEIEAISDSGSSSDESIPVTGSYDVSLYRIGGWAMLSVIKDRKKKAEKCEGDIVKKQLILLQALTVKRKDKSSLVHNMTLAPA